MGFVNRFMTAIRAGLAVFNESALIPIEDLGWDTYAYRLMRYDTGERYCSNSAYKILRAANNSGVIQRKLNNKLNKRIRGIYNPVSRQVEIYVAKTYGGAIDFDNFASGAIPLENANDGLILPIKHILLWSNWRTQKDIYPRMGAKLGDVFIKVVDDTDREQVRLELLHPSKVRDAQFDATGRITRLMIEYQRSDDTQAVKPNSSDASNVQYYTYTELWDEDMTVSTYKDGAPFAFIQDGEGNGVAKWTNPYGFIPVKLVQHRNEGLEWGSTPYAASLDKIDELNDQASLLSDAIRKYVDPLWLFKGMQKSTLEVTDDDRDAIRALFTTAKPADVEAQALNPSLNIADTLNQIEHLQAEIERDMPELSMHKLRDVSTPTAPAIRAQFNDAIDRFVAAQANYDDGLLNGLQMALAIGGLRGYEDFRGFTADDYLKSTFEFSIKARPIIEDELTIQERITFLMQSGAPNRAVWAELNVPETDIAEWDAEAEANKQAMADLLNPPQDNAPTDTPQMMGGNQPPQLAAGNNGANNG